MTKKIIQTCDIVMEVTWLLALVSIPIYFNIYTSRVFEPDKITLFRSLVLLMVIAWCGKGLAIWFVQRGENAARNAPRKPGQRAPGTTEIIYPPDGEVIGPDTRSFPRNVFFRPLLPFAFFLCFVYLLSTIFSITPEVSWWGSYQRLQGTYTFLSYVLFFLVIAFNMRERRQLERLISFVLLANIPVALYGLLQHWKADPLPWQGDVVFRVTSSMGNAIFISAYLIMVVPLGLYRILTTGMWLLQNRTQAAKHFKGRNRDTALSWVALYGCFMLFLVGVFFAVLNFNANYRPEDTSGVAAASDLPRLAGDSASADSRVLVGNESIGPWWALPVGILLSFGLFFLFTVRRRGTDTNYLFRLFEFGSYLGLILIVFLTILYSESRGPEAGILFGLFIFFPILFWRRKAWKWLWGWLGLGLVAGILLVLFNLPAGSTPLEPVFKIARQNDQISRLGEFFQTNDGTGKVRQLIWKTVLEAVGDAAKHDPSHLIFGYGPETLYNVSPRFYQAELGQIEARNAIPDRSHNGYLDALVNTGIIGLVAYLAFVLAFLYYAFKFLRRTERFEYQVLLTALITTMLAHQVEIQTGIQIVSTWMMFWCIAALLLVMGGLIYGRWDAIGLKAVAATPVPVTESAVLEEAPPEPVLAGKNGKKSAAPVKEPVARSKAQAQNQGRNREKEKEPAKAASGSERSGGGGGRLSTSARRNAPVYANAYTPPDYLVTEQPVRWWYWVGLAVFGAVVLVYCWFGNVTPILADTVYKQGSNLAQAQQWQRAVPYFVKAETYAPSEDFYALYTGQGYLQLALGLVKDAATDKTKQATMLTYLKASEDELLKANKLAPLNPDHYANLARLYSRWSDIEPARAQEFLNKAVQRYEQDVNYYAPNNSQIWGELAVVQTSIATNRADPDLNPGLQINQAALQKAVTDAEQAVKIDAKYAYTRAVLGDIYRYAGRNADAGAQYVALAELDPAQLAGDSRFPRRMQALAQSPQVPLERALAAFNPDKADTTSINSGKATAYLGRGVIYYYKENLDQARQNLTNAANLAPNDPYAHAYMSLIYQRTGQTAQAQSEAAQARDLAGKVTQNPQYVQAAIESLLRGQ